MRVLVASATRHGATGEIAEAIASALTARGVNTETRRAEDVADVSGYDAVVLGSAVYMGRWLEPARQFSADHAAELAARPTWLFSSGPLGDPPVPDEAHAVQLGDLMERTRARGHRLFAGKLDPYEVSFLERTITRAVRAKAGDFRDWEAIRAWANSIADSLAGVPVARA